jgi:putative component of toxin-antitoxin plasmid stabilization module
MSDKGSKIGEVKTPSGTTYHVYWNQDTGDVYVAAEYAGNASSKAEAMKKANYYATTTRIMS